MVPYSLSGRRVWVAGHSSLIGRALCSRLKREDCEILTVSQGEVDLRRQQGVEHWLEENKPDTVIVAAATVGGIEANRTKPVDFLYDNLMIGANVIHAAAATDVKKLMYLGSSCFYPRLAEQPINEKSLLTGPLEPTNEAYALAKIASTKLCEAYRRQHGADFITAVPSNLYGPEDHFDSEGAHVIPSLISRFHNAKVNNLPEVTLWGTGSAIREFLYVGDAADGLVHVLKNYSDISPINVSGEEGVSIAQLAVIIAEVVGYEGTLRNDTTKPDGMPKKVLDASLIQSLSWKPKISLIQGLEFTYQDYLNISKTVCSV